MLLAGVSGIALGAAATAYATRGTRTQAQALQQQKEQWIAEQAQIEAQLALLQTQRDEYASKLESSESKRTHAAQQVALMELRIQESQKRMEDWAQQREQAVKDAQAAVMKAGQDLSSKLLEDHKREAEEAKKQSEERVKAVSEQTFKQLEEVQQAFAVLRNQQHANEAKMQSVWQALAAPASVGHMAEIGLENLLKSMGLMAGRDFVMQYAMDHHSEVGKQLRPDALLFLPQDTLMVVDSKASKFMLDMVDDAQVEDAEAGLKRTMQQHLKSLSGKDYRASIEAAFNKSHGEGRIKQILTVMYVPTDTMLAKIHDVDPDFFVRAGKANIILAGPSSLPGFMALASLQFNLQRQADNQEKILQNTSGLLDALTIALGHLEKVGSQFGTAAKSLEKTISSVNKRLLPKARQLSQLGVVHDKQSDMPERLSSYEYRQVEDMLLIEQEMDAPVLLDTKKAG